MALDLRPPFRAALKKSFEALTLDSEDDSEDDSVSGPPLKLDVDDPDRVTQKMGPDQKKRDPEDGFKDRWEMGPAKKFSRVLEKVAENPEIGFCGIKDVLRAKMVFTTPRKLAEALDIVDELAKMGKNTLNSPVTWRLAGERIKYRVVRLKNNFVDPELEYRDANVLLEVCEEERCIMGEVQVHAYTISRMKQDSAVDMLYTEYRTLEQLDAMAEFEKNPALYNKKIHQAVIKTFNRIWKLVAENTMLEPQTIPDENSFLPIKLHDDLKVNLRRQFIYLEKLRNVVEAVQDCWKPDRLLAECGESEQRTVKKIKSLHVRITNLFGFMFMDVLKTSWSAFCSRAQNITTCDGLQSKHAETRAIMEKKWARRIGDCK